MLHCRSKQYLFHDDCYAIPRYECLDGAVASMVALQVDANSWKLRFRSKIHPPFYPHGLWCTTNIVIEALAGLSFQTGSNIVIHVSSDHYHSVLPSLAVM